VTPAEPTHWPQGWALAREPLTSASCSTRPSEKGAQSIFPGESRPFCTTSSARICGSTPHSEEMMSLPSLVM